MAFVDQSRFRLAIQLNIAGTAMMIGMLGMLTNHLVIGIVLLIPSFVLLRRITPALAVRKEPFTHSERRLLLLINALIASILPLLLLLVALTNPAPAWWIFFCLAVVLSLSSFYYGYREFSTSK